MKSKPASKSMRQVSQHHKHKHETSKLTKHKNEKQASQQKHETSKPTPQTQAWDKQINKTKNEKQASQQKHEISKQTQAWQASQHKREQASQRNTSIRQVSQQKHEISKPAQESDKRTQAWASKPTQSTHD